ncbi:protein MICRORCHIDIA 2-like isoform X2 [Telopea speciosissima]|uniref:protein MICRORCHIDIA 2-like isoform X2 n=1 Tax=Telopea speciosissima TaxID=54955 RepID=UPI001CC58967|nr:protein MICRORCHIDIA 2-like isoform X2 [Telopea speciosissima]
MEPANVVDIPSSDDEDGIEKKKHNVSVDKASHTGAAAQLQTPVEIPESSSYSNSNQMSQLHCFWKAGDYDVGHTESAPERGPLEHARVHPKFLHSNATSHKWAFGAIAELLDNAVDEICNGATFVKVDKICNMKDNTPALLFQDDGAGMGPESMRKCMSLGYSSKKANTTIGQYGNGFKTSTMRLGADVIVFTRASCASHVTQSVGLLSYTFLRRTGQDDVIVPMVDFELSEQRMEPIIYSSQDDWDTDLQIILGWSPFASKEELMLQFEDIGPHGTKIIIFNLWLNDDGMLELEFDEDEEDIRLRDEDICGGSGNAAKHSRLVRSLIPYRIRFSLRTYASILYLRRFSNFRILLRGKSVQQLDITDELNFPKVVKYKPQLGIASKEEVLVETTIGFIKDAPLPISGFNVYHKNRLIRPFWKVTGDGSSIGQGVIGFLEANFIEPAHDKQDFERSSLFIRLEIKLKQIMNEFWTKHCHLIGYRAPGSLHHMHRECSADQPSVRVATNIQNEFPTDHHVIGSSANAQKEMHTDQPVIGLAANLRQELNNAPPGFCLTSDVQEGMPTVQPVIGLAAGSPNGVASSDNSATTLVDQICEENIQLFLRCEEHIQQENDLIQTIAGLEKELEETRRKCTQLSSYLESQRKLQTDKV